jgi:hypothetical protein
LNDGEEHETHGGEVLMVMGGEEEDTKVVFAQVPLLRSQLEALKQRSGTITTKDALTVAVHHYLHCPALHDAAASDADAVPQQIRAAQAERDDGGEEGEREGEEEDWWWSPPVKCKG